MPATIDADLFLNFFPGSVLETVRGTEHNVLVSYPAEPPEEDTIVELRVAKPDEHTVGRLGNNINSRAQSCAK